MVKPIWRSSSDHDVMLGITFTTADPGPIVLRYSKNRWSKVMAIKFNRIAWNPNTLSREHRYTFLKDKYGWVTGEISVGDSNKMETLIKKFFPNCEAHGTLPLKKKEAKDISLKDVQAESSAYRKWYNDSFTINLLIVLDTIGEDTEFAFLQQTDAFKLEK